MIQLNLEYAPAPPFDAGTPDRASPEVVKAVRERMASVRRERELLAAAFKERGATALLAHFVWQPASARRERVISAPAPHRSRTFARGNSAC
jgi:hypothetical protein